MFEHRRHAPWLDAPVHGWWPSGEISALESSHFAVDYVVLQCAAGGETRVQFASARSVTVTNSDLGGFGRPFDVDVSIAMAGNYVGPMSRGPRAFRQRFFFEFPIVGCDAKPVVVTLPPIFEAGTTTSPAPIRFFLGKFRYVGLQPVQYQCEEADVGCRNSRIRRVVSSGSINHTKWPAPGITSSRAPDSRANRSP